MTRNIPVVSFRNDPNQKRNNIIRQRSHEFLLLFLCFIQLFGCITFVQALLLVPCVHGYNHNNIMMGPKNRHPHPDCLVTTTWSRQGSSISFGITRTVALPYSFGVVSSPSKLHVSTTSVDNTKNNDMMIMMNARKQLLDTCQQLKNDYGIFLIEKSSIEQFKEALNIFERESSSSSNTMIMPEQMIGEWELICTTSIQNNNGIEIPALFNQGPLRTIRDSIRQTINRYWKVEQHINTNLDKIDHIIEYDPPTELQDVINNLPTQLTSFNINPLQVSSSKLSLVHKATVVNNNNNDSGINPLKIKLTLSNIVWNIAGTSTILDPKGKDIAQFPIPDLGDLLNAGEFDTTYVDDILRISRSKITNPILEQEQVRVFRKKGTSASSSSFAWSSASTNDVDDYIDPEFDRGIESPSDVEVL
jgi:PAP_fibrillin